MRVRGVSCLKVLLLVLATLVAMGAWGVYKGEQALAGEGPFEVPHFKCYETTGTPLNLPLRLFDQFRGFEDLLVNEIPSGGEDVTVKGAHLFCTPLFAKCFPEFERCEFFELPDVERNHLKCYKIVPSGPPVNQQVPVDDQFGPETLKVGTAQILCAPAHKGLRD